MKFFARLARRSLFACLLGALMAVNLAAEEVEVAGRRFVIPDGFELRLVAAPPLVDRPICADFDEQGRLYVADSSGSNEDVKTQLRKRPHRIVRLEDTNGDGRFDKSIVFADKMMFPEGAMWYDGSFYVVAPPSIWKLTDTDDDGVADQREEWFQGKTLTGCANDLHGPYLGPDGWIYWCKGAFAKQTYEYPDRPTLVTRAAHIFRMRPEVGPVEPVMTGGMDNPVEVVFTEGGERIFTTTFFQHPSNGQRDGLVHAIYGGVYGKKHGVIDEHPRTGDVMPVLTHLGAAAPSGLARLESQRLGGDYQGNLVAALFNMHRVTRHRLETKGASFVTQDEDLVYSDDIDFHPTDVLEDADGSLLVVDTGGWYKLCCPTSQLWKPDVLGGIYRLTRAGAPRPDDPRGLELDWSEPGVSALAQRLDDPRPAVRARARRELWRCNDAAVEELAKQLLTARQARLRRNSVWALTGIEGPAARAAVRPALADHDALVRQAAIHSAGVWRDTGAVEPLLAALESPALHNRRAAAEALGRIGDARAVEPLVQAAVQWHDRTLEHSLVYALIQINEPQSTRAGLATIGPDARRAVLLALDQMPDRSAAAKDVIPCLTAQNQRLREAAWWITSRRGDWADEMVRFFDEQTRATDTSAAARLLQRRLPAFVHAASVQQMMASALQADAVNPEIKAALLRTMSVGRVSRLPADWSREIERLIQTDDRQLVPLAVSAAYAHRGSLPQSLRKELVKRANDDGAHAITRLEALAAIAKQNSELSDGLFEFLCSNFAADHPPRIRALAVDVLVELELNPVQLSSLAETLPSAGPLDLKGLLASFDGCRDEEIGMRLVTALENSAAMTSLSVEELEQRFASYPPKVVERSKLLIEKLERETVAKREQVAHVLSLVPQGDVRRGQEVFHSAKTSCSACHALGYLGGTIGPDLTRIGRIRTERDLLEAVLFPSDSLIRSYEPESILMQDGRVFSGVIRNETQNELILTLDAQRSVTLATDEIEARKPHGISIMPAGIEKQLSPQELADLVLFLKTAR